MRLYHRIPPSCPPLFCMLALSKTGALRRRVMLGIMMFLCDDHYQLMFTTKKIPMQELWLKVGGGAYGRDSTVV